MLIIIIIIIRNGAKTISLQTSFGDLIIIIRNGAKTITLFEALILIVKKKRRIAINHPTTVGVM